MRSTKLNGKSKGILTNVTYFNHVPTPYNFDPSRLSSLAEGKRDEP